MDRKLVEQLRATVSVSKRKMLDAAADAIERLCLKCVDAAMLMDEIEAEAKTAIKYEQRVHMDWVSDRIGEWKCEQTDAELTDRIDRLRDLSIADQLIGKQVWITHWWCGLQITALREPQARTVMYVSVQKDGRIQLHVKDGTFGLCHLGESVFTDRQEAVAALGGRTIAVGDESSPFGRKEWDAARELHNG